MEMHQPFASQCYNTHWVPFRFTMSFIHFSSVQSTRCQLFCSPAIPTSAAFTLRMLIAHVVPPFRKASLRLTCIVQPPPYPVGKYTPAASYGAGIGLLRRPLLTSPSWGLAATFIRRSSSLRLLTAARLQRYSPAGLRGGLTSFLPQALLPAGSTH